MEGILFEVAVPPSRDGAQVSDSTQSCFRIALLGHFTVL